MRQRNPPSQYRTDDFLFFKQALYQLSYRGKRRRWDLNPRRVLNRSFLAGKRLKPLGHFSIARTEGFEPPNVQSRKLNCCPVTTHSQDCNSLNTQDLPKGVKNPVSISISLVEMQKFSQKPGFLCKS